MYAIIIAISFFLIFHFFLSEDIDSKSTQCNWMFGYGSNMDETHVEIKKNLSLSGKYLLSLDDF